MEQLKHECGVAMIRLLKPLDYYVRKYGTWAYGFNKLYLMMEKQHNRGQEGAGIASVSLTGEPGTEYMFRERAEGKDAISEIFSRVTEEMSGELLMGHLRYSTTGKSGLQYVHPFLRRNNWRAKNLCLCGNFNMTNIDEVFQFLTAQGQSPRIYGDSYITLELMGHRLDREVERLFVEAKAKGLEGIDITNYIDDHVEMANVLRTTMEHYDGGYVMCGLTGSGEMFSVRDPWGIRPAFYYRNDEIVAVASERPVLQTTFNLQCDDIHELMPGEALIVRRNGESHLEQIMPAKQLSACSFERIYFSRGSDRDIYQERKRLGEQLTPAILQAIDGDIKNTVFSYIPNTAEVAYYGITDGFRKLHDEVRTEKVVWKDIKMRTFIADNSERNDLAAHVYDISYGSLRPHRRQHRARHHAAREHLQNPRPPAPQENRDGQQFAPDTLPRLLRHRYAASGGILRLPRHNGPHRGTRHAAAGSRHLPSLPARIEETQGRDAQPCARHLRTLLRRGNQP